MAVLARLPGVGRRTAERMAVKLARDPQGLTRELGTALADLAAQRIWPDPIVTAVSPAPTFWRAEDGHQNYYANNPQQGYCQAVVAPKAAKLRKVFAGRLKGD